MKWLTALVTPGNVPIATTFPPLQFTHLRALIKEDFPTFGIPTTITLIPLVYNYYKINFPYYI